MLRYLPPTPAQPRDPELDRRIAANRDRPPPGGSGLIAQMHDDADAWATHDPASSDDATERA